MAKITELEGYWNRDGLAGVRAHTLVLSLNSFCNTTTKAISEVVSNCVPVTHPHGRNEVGTTKERLDRALMGTVLNPNVNNVLLVGYEPKTTEAFMAEFKKRSKKRIENVLVLENGTLNAIHEGSKKAIDLVMESSELKREPINWSDLILGVKCGGSDATSGISSNPAVGYAVDHAIENGGTAIFSETTEIIGAEHILARRTANEDVTRKIYEATRKNEEMAILNGVDLVGTNPVPDNIKGGLSTIEEKSLGAVLKAGTTTLMDVLGYAEKPQGKGLYFMDSPSAATEVSTALAAAGCQMILFSTGNGNPMGNPIVPVIKVTGNPRTADVLNTHIDVDVSSMISGNTTLEQAGKEVVLGLSKVIGGRLTKAEILKHYEYSPAPIGL